ncbi:MAG: F0F1 ATP synthase subunit B [Planctomycetaceae bacterium]|nr:F0F1 ATP synthase subunit B [Planctomycetaceae bacterium]
MKTRIQSCNYICNKLYSKAVFVPILIQIFLVSIFFEYSEAADKGLNLSNTELIAVISATDLTETTKAAESKEAAESTETVESTEAAESTMSTESVSDLRDVSSLQGTAIVNSEITNRDDHGQKVKVQAEDQSTHKKPNLNPLEMASDTAVWSLVIFLLVFGILGKFAFGPIAKALAQREANIAEKIDSAQRTNDEAKEILQQYQDKLDKSKEEVRIILDTARKDGEKIANEIIVKARESAVQERERAMKEIEGATTFALQKIAEQSATLVTNLAGKIIHAEIKPEHHRVLIHDALDEFTNTKS